LSEDLSTEKEHEDTRQENEYSVALMLRAKEDDIAAFEELIVLHQKKVASFIYQLIRSGNDVEDLCQQVFIKLWKSRHSYEPKAKFLTFLFLIAKRLVFNEVKRAHRKNEKMVLDAPEESGGIAYKLTSETEDPAEMELKLEKARAIEAAINELPEKARLAIILKKDDQLSYEAIAEIVGVTVPALKSLLFRARQELRESLSRYLGE